MKLYPQSFVPKSLPLSDHERKITQPLGVVEEGLFEYLSRFVRFKYCVEVGAGDGSNHSFTRNLIEKHGYSAFLVEADPKLSAKLLKKYQDNAKVAARQAFVSEQNLPVMFREAGVPKNIGFLCIDVDGNDYHLWKSLLSNHRADIVCIEYNASFGCNEPFVIPHKEDFVWSGDDYYGASFRSLVELGEAHGYRLIHCTTAGDNLIFAHSEIASHFASAQQDPKSLYQIPQYGRYGRAVNGKGHPVSNRTSSWSQRLWYRLRYHALAMPRKLVYAAHDPKGHEK